MEFNATKELIEDIADGKMVILLDDEDRENEGDLVCAAELIDDKKINLVKLEDWSACPSHQRSVTSLTCP
jgi:3,4-dihydroxy-2-butanone 4-phosphate synthase